MEQRRALVHVYFNLGLSNREILASLALYHRIIISIRTLKRITKAIGLYRRKNHSDIVDVALFINDEIRGPGEMNGYRWMHLKCIQNGLVVTQNTVRLLMGIIDPEGVDVRKRRRLRRRRYGNPGPNAVWHVDGYDKLSPYGIYIHGCVDGFSRYLIWLNAYNTNKDPKVIAGYYAEAIENNYRCPAVIRSDRGTENGLLREMQVFIRRNHGDQHAAENSFRYGKSTTNQRIEWQWGMNRKHGIQYWMNLFQKLKEDWNFSGDLLDKSLIRFCFTSFIQVRFIVVLLCYVRFVMSD